MGNLLRVTTIFSLLLFITVQPYIAEGIASLSKKICKILIVKFSELPTYTFYFLILTSIHDDLVQSRINPPFL